MSIQSRFSRLEPCRSTGERDVDMAAGKFFKNLVRNRGGCGGPIPGLSETNRGVWGQTFLTRRTRKLATLGSASWLGEGLAISCKE